MSSMEEGGEWDEGGGTGEGRPGVVGVAIEEKRGEEGKEEEKKSD